MKKALEIKLVQLKSLWAIIFCVSFFINSNTLFSQNLNSKIEAGIVTSNLKDDMLEIVGTAKNLTEGNYSLRYELSVITSGNSGNSSKNAQSGRFTLEPFEVKNLSKTTISIDPRNRTILLLLIYNQDDELMGTDRVVYDTEEQEKAEEEMSYQKKNEGIQLTGMVTDRTKTKPGKDFYGYFYQKYSLSPFQGNKLIEVDEVISFGRTTKIMVKIDGRTVFQFFARPKLDYLKEMSDHALRQVNRYFEYLKNRSESLTQY